MESHLQGKQSKVGIRRCLSGSQGLWGIDGTRRTTQVQNEEIFRARVPKRHWWLPKLRSVGARYELVSYRMLLMSVLQIQPFVPYFRRQRPMETWWRHLQVHGNVWGLIFTFNREGSLSFIFSDRYALLYGTQNILIYPTITCSMHFKMELQIVWWPHIHWQIVLGEYDL